MSQAFEEYCNFFHQDIFVMHGSMENAIAANVADLRSERLKELKIYLETFLSREPISSKSLLRKTIRNIWFGNTQSARYFLEQTLKAVDDRLQQLREDKIKLYSRE